MKTVMGSHQLPTVPLIINGEAVYTQKTFPVVSPATGKCVWHCSAASKDDAFAAAEAAQAAFPAWSKTKPARRRDILLKAAQLMMERIEELSQYVVDECGSEVSWAKEMNVPLAAHAITEAAGKCSAILGSVVPGRLEGQNAMVFQEPWGVILGIAPWNAPYILGVRALIWALVAGNTVVFKASELSPRCHWAIVDVLQAAGLPAGVLNLIIHNPQDAAEISQTLIQHPAIRKINFTGSTHVGRLLAVEAAKNLKPILVELGGKASAIVCEDAELEKAAKACIFGSFANSGQICMSTEKILVHESILSDFKTALNTAMESMHGPHRPTPVLINSAAVQRNVKLISQATDLGATVLHGSPPKLSEGGTHLSPTVVADVKKSMDIYHTESFGPTVSLISVSSDDEAVTIANDSDYGLNAAIFSEDLNRAFKLARRIESGTVHINNSTTGSDVGLPMGGVKHSGYGRFGGMWGLEEFLQTKTVTWMD